LLRHFLLKLATELLPLAFVIRFYCPHYPKFISFQTTHQFVVFKLLTCVNCLTLRWVFSGSVSGKHCQHSALNLCGIVDNTKCLFLRAEVTFTARAFLGNLHKILFGRTRLRVDGDKILYLSN
jgi:hypothetical protein